MRVLRDVDWFSALLVACLCLIGLVFIDSATADADAVRSSVGKHAMMLSIGAVLGLLVVLTHYARFMRAAWLLYAAALLALAALPWFGVVVNGAQRWYRLPGGFQLQPTEFAKLALIVALASYLRFRAKATTWEGLFVPLLITAVPAVLILKQPDLGSSMVLWPVLLSMCLVAGTSVRALLGLLAVGVLAMALGFSVLHDYQRQRVTVWWQHFDWQPEVVVAEPSEEQKLARQEMIRLQRTSAYQPWQALIAIGSGGLSGFGIGRGPQNVHDFLPYRENDYIFAVVAEETGWLGCAAVLGLQLLLALRLLLVGARSRERFGRLLAVGVAAYLASQSLIHAAVCAWLLPAKGLPMPFLSHGGSSTLAAMLAVALVLGVSARREPVLAADGFV